MKLFLCSHFSSVGNLIKEDVENKKVVFIPTASIHEGYTGYVNSARKLFKKIGAILNLITNKNVFIMQKAYFYRHIPKSTLCFYWYPDYCFSNFAVVYVLF